MLEYEPRDCSICGRPGCSGAVDLCPANPSEILEDLVADEEDSDYPPTGNSLEDERREDRCPCLGTPCGREHSSGTPCHCPELEGPSLSDQMGVRG